jgi:hypothetical protein
MFLRRMLTLRLPSGDQPVEVRIHSPRQLDIDYECQVEIHWPGQIWRGSMIGVDECQAVFLALQLVGIRLYNSDHHNAGRLIWLEPGQGYGFPVTNNVRHLLVGDDAIYL